MKNKKKVLLSSILVIALCLSLIAGSTFALFTSESKVNIAVTSGKVKVVAALSTPEIYSVKANDEVDTDGETYAGEATAFGVTSKYEWEAQNSTYTDSVTNVKYYVFKNSGTASVDGNALMLDRMTPGDRVKFKVEIDNLSNVSIIYRVVISYTGDEDFYDELDKKVGPISGDDYSRKNLYTLERREQSTAWELAAASNGEPTDISDLYVDIALPVDAGNEYQEKSIRLNITVEAVQSNAAIGIADDLNAGNRKVTLDKLNKTLIMKNHTTMHDALTTAWYNNDTESEVLKDFLGVIAEKGILWNSKTDTFVYEDEIPLSANKYDYFKVYNGLNAWESDNKGYSIYANTGWTDAQIEGLTVGFDSGENTNITSIVYDRSNQTTARTVIIRTNSANTSLTVNGYVNAEDDKDGDVVYHYGTAGALNIIKCATSSYHENGKIAFAEISTGRIVLENSSEIKHIHINKKDDASFDTVVIRDNGASALPEAITRDKVSVTLPTLVVTVETADDSEEIYVYQHTDSTGETGTTEKTDVQNVTVSSALGLLVIDSTDDAGEKAMANNEKEQEKSEVVREAVKEETFENKEDLSFDGIDDVEAFLEYKFEKINWKTVNNHELRASCLEDGVILAGSELKSGEVLTEDLFVPAYGHDNHVHITLTGAQLNDLGLKSYEANDTTYDVEFNSAYCPRCNSPVASVEKLDAPIVDNGYVTDVTYSFKSFDKKNDILINGNKSGVNLFDMVYANDVVDYVINIYKDLPKHENPIINAIFGVDDQKGQLGALAFLDWTADFAIYFNKAVNPNDFGLAGSYDAYGTLGFKASDFVHETIGAYDQVRMLNTVGLKIPYSTVLQMVKEFRCGFFNTNINDEEVTAFVSLSVYKENGETDTRMVNMTPFDVKDSRYLIKKSALPLLEGLNTSDTYIYKIVLEDGNVLYYNNGNLGDKVEASLLHGNDATFNDDGSITFKDTNTKLVAQETPVKEVEGVGKLYLLVPEE